MNSSFISKYKPAIILTLALAVFLTSCKPSTKSWKISTLAGSGEAEFANGVPKAAKFNYPNGVAVDSDDNVYVADTGDSSTDGNRIRKITPRKDTSADVSDVTIFTAAQFHLPYGVAVDSSGNLYVADYGNNRIRKIEYKLSLIHI